MCSVRPPCPLSSISIRHSERSEESLRSDPDRFFSVRCKTQAFTVSNASAALLNRRAANSASAAFKNASHAASSANSAATPRCISGFFVSSARKSLTLNPRRPGNVVQPNWYSIRLPRYSLNIQIDHFECVVLNKFPARFDVFTHQRSENILRSYSVFEFHL